MAASATLPASEKRLIGLSLPGVDSERGVFGSWIVLKKLEFI
jgi:hypothetical protein